MWQWGFDDKEKVKCRYILLREGDIERKKERERERERERESERERERGGGGGGREGSNTFVRLRNCQHT